MHFFNFCLCCRMGKGLIWATAEDLHRNRGRVLSLYRHILRSLNSPSLPLTFAARLAKKAEVRAMFWVGSDERSLHNIADLIDAAEYSLSFLKKGQFPSRHICNLVCLYVWNRHKIWLKFSLFCIGALFYELNLMLDYVKLKPKLYAYNKNDS